MSRDPGRPPARESSVKKKLEAKLADLDKAWNDADDACNEALGFETKEGDQWAQFYHDRCMTISKERSKVFEEMVKRDDEKERRSEKFGKYGGRGRKTRRRMRGGNRDVWNIVRKVCGALGLREECTLEKPTPEQMNAVDKTTVPAFDQWGPPPEFPLGEDPAFVFPDPGKPPLAPKVARPPPESEKIRKEAFYLRDVARDLNKKGNRDLALKFMDLAKQAYARSQGVLQSETARAVDKKMNPGAYVGIAEKGKVGTRRGGKTRRKRRNKSRN